MTNRSAAVWTALLSVAAVTNAAAADELLDSAPVAYVVIYKPGPAWAPGKPISEQPPKEHGRYMLDLYEQGVLERAGAFLDDAGGMVLLKVKDAAQAKAIADADPAVKAGVFAYEIHPWRLVPWDKYLERRRARQQQQQQKQQQ